MPLQIHCPVCGSDLRTTVTFAKYSLKPYRVCPDCQSKYTADKSTRRRTTLIAVWALTTVGLSAHALVNGFPWGIAAAVSGTALLAYVGYALSKTSYVEYRGKR